MCFIAALGLTALVASSKAQRRKREAAQLRERLLAEEQKAREIAENAAIALAAKNTQLETAKKEADEANQAKSQFLASMSHELRTPLTSIIGFSEVLVEDAKTDGRTEQAEDAGRIYGSAHHLLGLINDLLDLSKIEAGKMTLYLETFEIAPLVRQVVTTIQPLVAKNGNKLEVTCAEDIGSMRADQTKVRQVLFNLLSNASKFTKNGTVELVVSNRNPGGTTSTLSLESSAPRTDIDPESDALSRAQEEKSGTRWNSSLPGKEGIGLYGELARDSRS